MTLILFKQHERCHYIDDPQCIRESFWKIDFADSTVKKIPLYIFDKFGNTDELKISPDGKFVIMKGHYTEQDGIEHLGLFVFDMQKHELNKIVDRTKTHVISLTGCLTTPYFITSQLHSMRELFGILRQADTFWGKSTRVSLILGIWT